MIIVFFKNTILLLFFLGGLLACSQEPPSAPPGVVEASKLYQQFFGPPPEVREGKAYARVAFLPLKADAHRVSAVPIYLFKENGHLESILNRLAGGELLLPEGSPMFNPFSDQVSLSVKKHQDKTLTLLLGLPTGTSPEPATLVPSIVETAAQFDDVERVIILTERGELKGMPDGGYQSDLQRISDVAPPGVIMISGIWDEGKKDPEEINVSFDRPVTVNSFQLSHADGGKVVGEYFTSIFQMAIVVHPDNPTRINEGLVLNAEWDVTDARGRSGAGREDFRLKKLVHKVELNEFGK
jgi:hypothetical protein